MIDNSINLKEFNVLDIDKKEFDWSITDNKLIMIVNVASKCGYTKQYSQLQKLYEKYKDQGLIILGFPCRQFMFQEFDDNEKIKEFCSLNYNVTFPMMDIINVVGSKIDPLYKHLIHAHPWTPRAKAVKWNFEKFFIKNNKVIGRYKSEEEPFSFEDFIKNNLN